MFRGASQGRYLLVHRGDSTTLLPSPRIIPRRRVATSSPSPSPSSTEHPPGAASSTPAASNNPEASTSPKTSRNESAFASRRLPFSSTTSSPIDLRTPYPGLNTPPSFSTSSSEPSSTAITPPPPKKPKQNLPGFNFLKDTLSWSDVKVSKASATTLKAAEFVSRFLSQQPDYRPAMGSPESRSKSGARNKSTQKNGGKLSIGQVQQIMAQCGGQLDQYLAKGTDETTAHQAVQSWMQKQFRKMLRRAQASGRPQLPPTLNKPSVGPDAESITVTSPCSEPSPTVKKGGLIITASINSHIGSGDDKTAAEPAVPFPETSTTTSTASSEPSTPLKPVTPPSTRQSYLDLEHLRQLEQLRQDAEVTFTKSNIILDQCQKLEPYVLGDGQGTPLEKALHSWTVHDTIAKFPDWIALSMTRKIILRNELFDPIEHREKQPKATRLERWAQLVFREESREQLARTPVANFRDMGPRTKKQALWHTRSLYERVIAQAKGVAEASKAEALKVSANTLSAKPSSPAPFEDGMRQVPPHMQKDLSTAEPHQATDPLQLAKIISKITPSFIITQLALLEEEASVTPNRRRIDETYPLQLSPSLPISKLSPPGALVPIAKLAHGLDRVLFNPGVHFLQDPRSGVFNFSPFLKNLPKIEQFQFDKLPAYITASKDPKLAELAKEHKKLFVGSTSSTTAMLCQIYFWLSAGKRVNFDMLSAFWSSQNNQFSMGQRLPASIIAHFREGHYAIDADKSIDVSSEHNVLARYGHLMEKILTTEEEEFSRFLVDSDNPARSEADDAQAYHYMQTDKMILRSQLDAHDPRLPRVTFDVKTRATVAIRQDRLNYEAAAGYELNQLQGEWGSFEREYYDLIRSAFLKYQFQARIGGMDGVIVAHHTTAAFCGFQYIPIEEMDAALFGSQARTIPSETMASAPSSTSFNTDKPLSSKASDRSIGDNWFRLCLGFLEVILTQAIASFPGRSLRMTFAAETKPGSLLVFVSPADVKDPEDPIAQGRNAVNEDSQTEGKAEGGTQSAQPTMVVLELRSKFGASPGRKVATMKQDTYGTAKSKVSKSVEEDNIETVEAVEEGLSQSQGSSDDDGWVVRHSMVKHLHFPSKRFSVPVDVLPTEDEGRDATRFANVTEDIGHTTVSSSAAPINVPALLAETRSVQRMFNSVALPEGVDLASVLAAHEAVRSTATPSRDNTEDAASAATPNEYDAELLARQSDLKEHIKLAQKFPMVEGMEYRERVSKGVRVLRHLARKGRELKRHAASTQTAEANADGKKTPNAVPDKDLNNPFKNL